MIDTHVLMFQDATDTTMTFMPRAGKTPPRIAREIERVFVYMQWEAEQTRPPVPRTRTPYPETGLLKEPSTMLFLEKWAREAEAELTEDREDLLATR